MTDYEHPATQCIVSVKFAWWDTALRLLELKLRELRYEIIAAKEWYKEQILYEKRVIDKSYKFRFTMWINSTYAAQSWWSGADRLVNACHYLINKTLCQLKLFHGMLQKQKGGKISVGPIRLRAIAFDRPADPSTRSASPHRGDESTLVWNLGSLNVFSSQYLGN